MNTLLRDYFVETPVSDAQPRVTPVHVQVERPAVSHAASLHDDQIHGLVQRLFFRRGSALVRHVGFCPVESSAATAALCLDAARILTEEGSCDVGLIDAHLDSDLLQTQLQIPSPSHAQTTWPIGPRLWMVPRQSWLPEARGPRIAGQNLSRLRELTTEFDFSILWCAPVSWLTASIGHACDGLVLVLTANKTRRFVAAQIKDQLTQAQVPLLGTILAERRFPVPQGLYRNL